MNSKVGNSSINIEQAEFSANVKDVADAIKTVFEAAHEHRADQSTVVKALDVLGKSAEMQVRIDNNMFTMAPTTPVTPAPGFEDLGRAFPGGSTPNTTTERENNPDDEDEEDDEDDR